ncbi:efflux RND transporter permease subunit [Chlorobium phaeovibrioides]|uniref:Efflux RND transporter permease subunit n=1 Tax=Chlorobium phaeovibrioides TaxID=1094 RepID=A0A5M8IDN3_CHLPH|nr:efflux RND transporter permease subunit [Chlorobium phaeovibrioides]KAA6232354.1 efflux RND transporter permease subunit [Chlorobium phaeovibrioides]
MFERFITRPVLATVISVIIVILGIVGMTQLPVTRFPDIAPPSVTVTASYPGASAETVGRSVAPPLEEAINGVENMIYMTSTSANDGSLSINVFFKQGTNADQAAVNVQNRVAQATSRLPAEVNQIGVSTIKRQNSMIMLVNLSSATAEYDQTFLQNYAKINVVDDLARVPGVGQVSVYGNMDYSMRLWLRPEKMAAYRVNPQEVMAAINSQNLEAAPGSFGENGGQDMQYVMKYPGKFAYPGQYENIVIRANSDGSLLKLGDIARVEFGAYSYNVRVKSNGLPGIVLAVYQAPGSNANEVETQIRKVLENASADFPSGISVSIPYSSKKVVDDSIEQVQHTLIEAFLLVFLVAYIFLQDFRSTLIPAIAVPVAILGTFFFMNLFGFSINVLTLFGLVLAIGIVVDDAIVVVEAVHAKMEKTRWPATVATVSAMREITTPIITITLVMASVFLPVGFLEGSTGVFYRQFAFTLAIAVLISAVNALTLSPALCALFLGEMHQDETKSGAHRFTGFQHRFFTGFNTGFTVLKRRYLDVLALLLRKRTLSLFGLALITAAAFWMFKSTPTGFIPDEDNGFVIVSVSMPPGASLERTQVTMDRAAGSLREMQAVNRVISVAGINILSRSSSPSSGLIFMQLNDLHERGPGGDIKNVLGSINGRLSAIKEGSFFALSMPTVPGFSTVGGLEFVLQDRSGGSLEAFNGVSGNFIGQLMQRPEIAFAFTTFNASYPQFSVEVDAARAKRMGVDVSDLMSVMQAYYGSMQASDFNRFGKYYRVVMQAEPDARSEPSSLNGIFIKNSSGEMVPVGSLLTIRRVYGPESVDHFNLFNAIPINAVVSPGYSTGQAIAAVAAVSADALPTGFSYDWKGQSREELESSGGQLAIFLLSVIFVYFLLSALYESYLLPLAVMLSIPTGLLGVFIGIGFAGIENNIYVQVAIIMLIGLLAKNAILIVEFAIQRRVSGMSLSAAALQGANARLRPILMTSLTFVAGLIPLLFVTGPAAAGNHSIGAAAIGGMFIGMVLGLLVVPVLFVVFQHLQERLTGTATEPVEAGELLEERLVNEQKSRGER